MQEQTTEQTRQEAVAEFGEQRVWNYEDYVRYLLSEQRPEVEYDEYNVIYNIKILRGARFSISMEPQDIIREHDPYMGCERIYTSVPETYNWPANVDILYVYDC